MLKRLLVCFLGLSVCLGARAQQRHEKDVRNDIAALKQDIAAIGAQQRQVIEQLDQLKQFLDGRLGPPPPQPPSDLSLQNQDFRGDRGAEVAIIEYADFECPYCGQYEQDIYPQISKDYIQTGK